MNPINAVEATTLESLFQVAYEATIQAEQQRLHWNGRKFSEQADAAWESFHSACERFRRQYRPGLTAPQTRIFTLYWKHGEVQTVSAVDQGNQLDTLSAAMNEAGIGNGALPALDYWKEEKGLVPGPFNMPAVHSDYEEDYHILEGPTAQDEAVGRFNALLKNANWEAVDFDTAVGYLESNDFDPWTPYLEFGRDNPDWHEEALTAPQRNV